MNNNREELQNYYNDLFKYGNYKRIDNIPDEYKTQEMCDRYAKNKTFDIRLIPEKFITQEICEKYLKKGGNLNNIPKLDKLDLEKLCNIYMDLRISNFKDIPDELLTQEMCNKYTQRIGFDIKAVPDRFMTQEMISKYLKNKGHSILDIPESFRTYEMYEQYIKDGGLISNVPDKYLNQEIYNIYARVTASKIKDELSEIPDKFKSQELYDSYLTGGGDLFGVPEEFRNRKWHERYIEEDDQKARHDQDNEINVKKVYFFLLKIWDKIQNNKDLTDKEITILVNLNRFYEQDIEKYFSLNSLYKKIMEARDIVSDIAYITKAPEDSKNYGVDKSIDFDKEYKKIEKDVLNGNKEFIEQLDENHDEWADYSYSGDVYDNEYIKDTLYKNNSCMGPYLVNDNYFKEDDSYKRK